MVKVSNVMTVHPITLSPTDTVREADEIMAEENVRQLPVVDKGELVGIVTDRDIRSFLGGYRVDTLQDREKAMHVEVSQVMTRKPFTLQPDDDFRDAVEVLLDEKVGGIPVVDNDSVLVGIITYMDALRYLSDRLDEE